MSLEPPAASRTGAAAASVLCTQQIDEAPSQDDRYLVVSQRMRCHIRGVPGLVLHRDVLPMAQGLPHVKQAQDIALVNVVPVVGGKEGERQNTEVGPPLANSRK